MDVSEMRLALEEGLFSLGGATGAAPPSFSSMAAREHAYHYILCTILITKDTIIAMTSHGESW